MSGDIGINLRVNADTSGLRNAGDDIGKLTDGISSAISGIDPAKAEEFWAKMAAGAEKFRATSGGGSGSGSADGQSGGAGGDGPAPAGSGSGGRVVPFPGSDVMRLSKALRGTASGLNRDAGGAIVDAGEGIIGQLGKLWTKMPLAAKVATGVGAAGVAAGVVGNELSKTYEAVIPQVMSVTAALGRFGATADEQSKLFRSTMSDLSSDASSYGYTLQQGSAVVESLARGGVKNARSGGASVMAFAKGYGMQNIPGELSDFYGLASRMGANADDALGYVAGGARSTVGDGRMQEFMRATQDILEDGLSEGVIKGFGSITGTQRFLSSMFGPLGGGERGAQLYSKLSSGVRGAVGMQSETDLLLFQAARAIGSPGESTLDTQGRLEAGFSPEIFKQFKSGISGASADEQIRLIRKAFGVSIAQAKTMYGAKTDSELSEAVMGKFPGGAIAGTAESQITGNQEMISNGVRGVGAEALDIKNGVLSKASDLVDLLTGKKTLDDLLGIDAVTVESAQAIVNAQSVVIEAGMGNVSDEFYAQAGTEKGKAIWGKIAEAVGGKAGSTNPLSGLFGGTLSTTLDYSMRDKDMQLGQILSNEKNWDVFKNMSPSAQAGLGAINSRERGDWTASERDALLAALVLALQENTQATAASGKAGVTVTVPTGGPMTGRGR